MSDMMTIQDEVRQVMRESMGARECDLTAWVQVMDRFHPRHALDLRAWIWSGNSDKAPSLYPTFEAVRRARQKVQANGELLPDNPRVLRSRKKTEKKMLDYVRDCGTI